MPENLIKYLEKTINFIIKGVIFLLPLFFLPWTGEYFEFNKQFLLWLAMDLALFLWLIKQAFEGKAKIKTNPLNLPIIIFLSLSFVSGIFSLDIFSSFFGSDGNFSNAWLGLLSLVIFYFLLINAGLADSPGKIFILFKLLFYSAFFVAAISLLSMSGASQLLTANPLNILASPSFNPAGGSLLSLAIFLAVLAVAAGGFLFSGTLKKFDAVVFSLLLILFLIVLILINFSLSWIVLIIGACLLFISRFLEADFNFKKILNYYLLIPLILMLVAIFWLVSSNIDPAKIVFGRSLPPEATLDYKTSFLITKKAIFANPVLGSGPATFSYNFSLYRPSAFNKSDYWKIRFDKSFSQFLEILATLGLPAWLSYFLIISLIIYINIILFAKYFKKREPVLTSADYNLASALFTAFILLVISQLFFYFNTVLNFSFWFLAALTMAFWQNYNQALFKEKTMDLNKTVLFFRIWPLILFFLAGAIFISAGFKIKFFAADIAAASSSNREAGLLTAVKLNPYRANYNISLAEFYLNRVRLEAAKPKGKENNNFIQSNISQSIKAGRLAASAAPNSVKTQETLGMIYRDIVPLTVGAEIWAEQFFKNSLNFEPTNPVLTAELARIYLNNNDIVKAEEYFIKTLALKPDYYEAKFGLAKVYLKDKKDNLAFKLLNELAEKVMDREVFYELGRFYYNNNEIDKAIERFKLALSLSPKHSNSLYSLGIAYEAKGDIKTALKYYRQVLELNQGNEEVEKKIKELSK